MLNAKKKPPGFESGGWVRGSVTYALASRPPGTENAK
jgi:hypothetical protein